MISENNIHFDVLLYCLGIDIVSILQVLLHRGIGMICDANAR